MNPRNFHYLILLVSASLGTIGFADDTSWSLTVTVEGAKPSTGQILLSLFSSKANYLKAPVKYHELEVDANGSVNWTFKNLATGTYAVSAVYDEDSNGKLNTGFMGIPTELIGMSNNAKGRFGPPSFKKTSFPLSESGRIVIHLGKAKG